MKNMNNDESKRLHKSADYSIISHRKRLKVENYESEIECVKQQPNLFFSNMNFYVLSTGIGKKRFHLLQNQIRRYGGKIVDSMMDSVYVVVDDSLENSKLKHLLRLKEIPSHLKVVKSVWLSKCLEEQRFLPLSDFDVILTNNLDNAISNISSSKITVSTIISDTNINKTKADGNDNNQVISTDGDYNTKQESIMLQTNAEKDISKMNRWICSYSATEQPENYNKHITEKLEILADIYKNTKDHWRTLGYQKALTALKNHPKKITTRQEALSLPGIGQRLADKIWEIIESGHLRKIDEVCSSSKVEAINLFTKIWGAGPATAELWVQQGFQTLDDLRTKAKLTHQQEIGLKHFDDLLDRMPREEAEKIAETVKLAALSINSGLQVEACGSYRRGKKTCGDVDILVTHSDGKSHEGILEKVVDKLHQTGFLTDDLVKHGEYGNQKKYLGVCKLSGENNKHRRLDIITVPYNELACALLYFTGSAHFNRSMRLLARKKGMALSEHSLNGGVVRNGQIKVNEGYILPTPTEESIFVHLGLQYRTPKERDH